MKHEPTPTVRAMTWNIHGGIGPDHRFDLRRVVDLVRRWDPDVLAVQEVDSRHPPAGHGSPFTFLRESLGHHGIEAKSITTADGDYGQMLISRWPLEHTVIHDLTVESREPRRAIETEVLSPSGRFRLVATHFGLNMRERRRQARRLVEIARRHPMTTVMLGDFNDWFWPSVFRDALKREMPARTPHPTYPSMFPLLCLDRIYCWPRECLRRSLVDHGGRAASDHLPVIADIAVDCLAEPAQAAARRASGANRP